MKKSLFLLITILIFINPALAEKKWHIERSVRGELFVINGNRFTARDNCSGIRRGDTVKFIEGSPDGECISAIFIDARNGNRCDVWCY